MNQIKQKLSSIPFFLVLGLVNFTLASAVIFILPALPNYFLQKLILKKMGYYQQSKVSYGDLKIFLLLSVVLIIPISFLTIYLIFGADFLFSLLMPQKIQMVASETVRLLMYQAPIILVFFYFFVLTPAFIIKFDKNISFKPNLKKLIIAGIASDMLFVLMLTLFSIAAAIKGIYEFPFHLDGYYLWLVGLTSLILEFLLLPKNQTVQTSINSSFEKPQNLNYNNLAKKMSYLFIFINLILLFIALFIPYWHINKTCYEMGCLAAPVWIFIFCFPAFFLFVFVSRIIYNKSIQKIVDKTSDVFKYKSFLANLIISIILIIGIILALKMVYIDYPKFMQEEGKQQQEQNAAFEKRQIEEKPASDRDDQRHMDTSNIAESLSFYKNTYGKYPNNLNELITTNSWRVYSNNKSEAFPVDPLTHKPYIYIYDSKKDQYLLCTFYELELRGSKSQEACYNQNTNFQQNYRMPVGWENPVTPILPKEPMPTPILPSQISPTPPTIDNATSSAASLTEPYPNITVYPNAPIGFYAHDLDGKCCAYRGGCDQQGCGNKCTQIVDESFCNKLSPTP